MKEQNGRERRTLTLGEYVRLVDWLRRVAPTLAADLTYAQVAERAAAELSMDVGPHTIRNTAKAAGIAWSKPESRLRGGLRLDALEKRVEKLERTIGDLLA